MLLLFSGPVEICTNLDSQDLLGDQLTFCPAWGGGAQYPEKHLDLLHYPIPESPFKELRVQIKGLYP